MASAEKKYPSRATANGTRAPLMIVPFKVTSIDNAIPKETNPAPIRPITSATASEAGRFEAAMASAGNTYCTPKLTST